jgi:hypothetical protein
MYVAELIFLPINSLLPAVHFPAWASGTQLSSDLGGTIGGSLAGINGVIPVDPILTVLGDVLALWPYFVAYLVFSWIWRHVPTIAGFGTGDG